MSYQPLNIVIREAKLTDFLTDLSVIFNTNDAKLKSEIEKVVNGLQLNTSTGVVGEPDSIGNIPINEINSRTMFLVLPGIPVTGWKLGFKNAYNGAVVAGVGYESTAVEQWSVSFASDVYNLVMGTQSAGYRAQFDRLTVNTVMQAMFGKFDMIQLSNVAGLFDCSAVAQFNGPVIHRSGHKESIVDAPILMQFDGSTTLYTDSIVIGRTTPENIFLHLEFDSNGYDSGSASWVGSITNIELRLKIDQSVPTNLPLPGQVFNFILKSITDVSNQQIVVHPTVDIVLKANETVPGTPDFEFKNFGAAGTPPVAHTKFSEMIFIPKAASVSIDSLDTYGSDISFIYNRESLPGGSIYTQSHMMYVKNAFVKE